MTLIFSFASLALGLIIGSFLNVVIVRMNTARSLAGRSACMSCRNKLSWYELVPVLSFLALRGRCRTCKTRISLQYPLVEAASGLVFLALFFKFENLLFINLSAFALSFIYYAAVFSLLLVIAVYDLKHKIIPDKLALILGIVSFLGLFLFSNGIFHMPALLDFMSGIFVALPFAMLWFFSRGAWMGLGDAKLALSLGWLLGLSMAFSAIVLAFWAGALVGVYLIFFSKSHGLKSEIPFAPYLVLGSFLVFFFGLNFFNVF